MTVILGSGGKAFPQLFITKSQTWVPPQDGNICIHAVGAGGGGGQSSSSTNEMCGGGAGAYFKVPSLAVTTSGSFTIVIGAGGRGGYNGSSTTGTAGANGGNTTIAGTGLTGTKTAGGGVGAVATGAETVAGGSFSGSGESVVGYTGGASAYYSGGAVGVYATGEAGKPVNNAQNGAGQSDSAGSGIETSGYGYIVGGRFGGANNYNWYAGNGMQPSNGDDLCGGGYTFGTTGNQPARGGNGGLGGGGGGARNNAYVQNAYGGNGGDGIILIQYLPW